MEVGLDTLSLDISSRTASALDFSTGCDAGGDADLVAGAASGLTGGAGERALLCEGGAGER